MAIPLIIINIVEIDSRLQLHRVVARYLRRPLPPVARAVVAAARIVVPRFVAQVSAGRRRVSVSRVEIIVGVRREVQRQIQVHAGHRGQLAAVADVRTRAESKQWPSDY